MLLPDTPHVRSRIDILYLVTREFNAGLDIDQILHRVLGATVASVGASDASLFLFDAKGKLENFYLISGFEMQERSRGTVDAIHKKGLIAWVKEHRQPALIKDTSTDERWFMDENNAELSKVGSAVSVPIQLPDQLLGVLTITATEPNFFDESNEAMLTIIADQAAFAIANARLFEAEQHRRSLADTLASIAHTINSTLDLNEVLELILEQLALVIDYDSSSIFLYNDEDNTLTVRAVHGFEGTLVKDALNVTLPMTKGLPNYRVITEKKAVVLADVDVEPDWIKTPSSEKIRSWIGVPLIARDQVIGMLTIDSYEVNKYSEENVKDVVAFADQAATAVANAQSVTFLQNAEASYTALFEDNTDMIVITNYQGIILNVNRRACRMLWRAKPDFIGSDISLIDKRLKEYLSKQKKKLKSWQEASLELDVLTYQQTISLEFKARQVHYDGKDCVQWVGRDISARKEAERLRQDLIKMLVHDLRGPLGNLINTIDLLPRLIGPTEDNPSLNEILGVAKRNSQDLKDMIDSMLDVSRHQQSRNVPIQPSRVELDKIIETIKDQVASRANAKKMELVFDPLPDLPPLWVDESMLRRVLVNLIDNAIKYTPNKGKISVTASQVEDALHLAISDNGPGIDKTDQANIFDKFFRVDHSDAAPSGVGLGLAFCKLAVEAHDGTISVESEGIPGQGSTFHISIPLTSNSE